MIRSSIKYYKNYYRLVAVAVFVMMAVLSGSLLVGDAVRGTLVDRVHERLGDTETVITSGTGFLQDEIMKLPLMKNARGILMCDGFVSHDGKMIPVQVWGTDDDSLGIGEAQINEPLLQKLNGERDFVLHLPAHSLVPSGTLFVTKSYSTQLRLHAKAVKTVEDGGNMLLRNEQTLPLNVFMSREELAEQMGLEGKINLILSPDFISEDDLSEVWRPQFAGLAVKDGAVTSDRIFLTQPVVDALQPRNTYLAYLVNNISTYSDSVPYSFVTAVDKWKGEQLVENEAILSDYAAKRLHLHAGDSIRMDYFITRGMKSLETQSQSFVVKQVVPLEDFIKDSLLKADFPGLSNVERCADWDSDLPIDMDKIEKEDEDFWYAYHQTPKAIVSYDAVKSLWGTAFGVATALECQPNAKVWSSLTPQLMGVMVIHPQEAGLYAAQNGTDFSSLFLALGFLIILSAILLMQNPLVEMVSQRKKEVELYKTLGFTRKRIYTLLLKEIFAVIPIAGVAGVVGGILYSAFILFLLGTVWSGATNTEGFRLHINALTLLFSYLAGLAVCAVTAFLSIRKPLFNQRESRSNTHANKAIVLWIIGVGGFFIMLFLYNLLVVNSIILFVVCGLLWLIASALSFTYFILRKSLLSNPFSKTLMLWKSLAAQRSQVLLSYWALAVGVFTVFAVGLNRPDLSSSADNKSATGGYSLWCENRIPIEYDLNNADVRKKLSLQDLGEDVHFLQLLKYTQDEASCLNLNKVATPTVLGVDLQQLQRKFGIDTKVLAKHETNVYPILMDEESLLWSMGKSVGDTLQYNTSEGKPVQLLIAGSYPTGILHGSALMDKALFHQLWKDESGSRIMLLDIRSEKQEYVKDLLETALNEYGISVITTTERIEHFFTVTDTYLTIFLTLGGLGLFLGVFSLVIVIRKILLSRRSEIQMLLTLGYSVETLRRMYFRESLIVPLVSITMGAIGSTISISANLMGASANTWLLAVIALSLIVVSTIVLMRKMVDKFFYSLRES